MTDEKVVKQARKIRTTSRPMRFPLILAVQNFFRSLQTPLTSLGWNLEVGWLHKCIVK